MNVITHKYPDTAAGATECFRSLSTEEIDLVNVVAWPDRYLSGVWMLDKIRLHDQVGRAIVYMAGYNGRTENDFESDLD